MDFTSDFETAIDVATQISLAKENVLGLITNLTLLNLLVTSLMEERNFPKTKTIFEEEYDYVIIGGGTAGSVMANRLSQNPCVNILLLEAGGEAPILTEVPSYARVFLKSDIDWQYKTTPQKYAAFGQIDNRVLWNSGKALGGGSLLNAMLYSRGNKENYDNWAAEGATGWGYDDVLPYFLKLEDNRNLEELDPDYHAISGPVTVEKPKYTPEMKTPIIRAMETLGYNISDVNGERQTGVYDLQGTLRNGQRCSAAKAYLVPVDHRPNLDIIKNAFARKILIENNKAYGVQFDFNGTTHIVYAKKEVVISCGTVRTAQILMLSGIGPKEHLKDFGIPIVADLPVGQNLHDHPAVYLRYTINSRIKPLIRKNINPVNILQYIENRSGPLAAPFQCNVIAFVDGENATNLDKDFPAVQLYFLEFTTFDELINSNFKAEIFEHVYKPYIGRASYACVSESLQPKSRGEILLNSTDPYDHPLINPNYLKEESDVRDIVEGMKLCQMIAENPEMGQMQAKSNETVFPGCEEFDGDEDMYLACQARSMVVSFWDPVGTARMGQPDDPRSVVDPQLRVIGVEGLRVVNAAVMPIIPSGNTNVPTIMVAEKAYDMMKGDILCTRKAKCGGWRNCRKKRRQNSKISS